MDFHTGRDEPPTSPLRPIIPDNASIFTLNNVASNAQITISYIGMKSQTLSVNGKTSFKIVLKEDSEVLDEVVVVGYNPKEGKFDGSRYYG